MKKEIKIGVDFATSDHSKWPTPPNFIGEKMREFDEKFGKKTLTSERQIRTAFTSEKYKSLCKSFLRTALTKALDYGKNQERERIIKMLEGMKHGSDCAYGGCRMTWNESLSTAINQINK